ncbi:thiol reductant ABC exporter subunit CydD [Gordonia sp. DT30]|uniref:thiol reductant ABC exporter subunit CydD n=1 Tax=Gordonia sp. DT30 TaxID=3416546 RepID=UPI003CF54249
MTRRAGPPIDPRLLRYSRVTRRYVVVTAILAAVTTVAVIVIAAMTASVLSELVTDPSRRSLAAQSGHLWILLGALVVRVIASFGHDRYAHRASASAIAELRAQALDALTDPDRTPPRELVRRREHATTVLLRGLGALGPYLSGYVPALIVTVLVTPTVLAVVAVTDWPSAVIIVITLPLIPLFMILIGKMTRERTQRKLATMSRLSAQLLDLVAGLPTLRALNRARAPARQVADLGQAHRRSSMSSLRVAFLSGGVLEFLATISVALVAVGIGLRLVTGEMSLYAGILALILAPEAYLPLRQVGAQFHNSTDGMAAAAEVIDLIETGTGPTAGARSRTCTVAGEPIRLLDVGVHGRDGWAPYELSATADPAALTVLTGPNGSGKSTAIAAILGLVAPDEGSVLVGSISVAELDPAAYHEQVAWLPQQPVVVPGTVADNLAVFGALDSEALARASAATGFDAVLASLPDGSATVLGGGGVGLSAGQRQRLALTRVLASPSPLLLLDEPTAHLDAASEASVLSALAARAHAGDTVVVVAHRAVARAYADRVIELPEVIGVR